MGKLRITQEGVVFALALGLFIAFAFTLNNFLTAGNLIALVRSVAILGILGLGMGLVVIGRGIDLTMVATMVATMVVSLSWVLAMAAAGMPLGSALLLGALFALAIGLANGVLIAYADIPAIFTTLAMGLVVYGAGRAWLFQIDVQNTPAGIAWFDFLGQGNLFGIPMPIVALVAVAALVAVTLLWTRFGRFIYAAGDNPLAARIGCDNIEKGLLDTIVSYDVPLQGISINQQIVQTLLSPAAAGETKAAYYTPLTLLTKENITPRNCWNLDQLK